MWAMMEKLRICCMARLRRRLTAQNRDYRMARRKNAPLPQADPSLGGEDWGEG
jgi:hypothetical protein